MIKCPIAKCKNEFSTFTWLLLHIYKCHNDIKYDWNKQIFIKNPKYVCYTS